MGGSPIPDMESPSLRPGECRIRAVSHLTVRSTEKLPRSAKRVVLGLTTGDEVRARGRALPAVEATGSWSLLAGVAARDSPAVLRSDAAHPGRYRWSAPCSGPR